MIEHALDYVRRGWAITPLHHVTDGGACSCGQSERNPDHWRQAGKHPVLPGWQLRPVVTEAQVRELWGAYPHANIGGLTGQPGGYWALDMDPDNGATIDDLPGVYDAATCIHRTGSGGYHFLWAIDDDWIPTNARGDLPPGWDVRGRGGQIVLPPSITAKGSYGILKSGKLAPAPTGLVSLIRGATATERPAVPLSPIATPAVAITAGAREAAYVRTVLTAELDALASASEGERNQTAFRVAARLCELVAAGWLPEVEALDGYLSACAQASARGRTAFPESEARQAWRSAQVKTAGSAATLPADTLHGEVLSVPSSRGPQ